MKYYARHRNMRWLSRTAWCLPLASFVATLVLQVPASVSAENYNYNRSIAMSTAKPGATTATYTVSFTVDSAYSLRTFVIDFCSNSPLVGQTCTAPGGFTVGGSPTGANLKINGSTPAGTWTATSQNSGRTFFYEGSSAAAVVAGDVVSFDITGVTNPNSVMSFYGRMLTYSTAAPAYSDTSTAVFVENGSVALATANGLGFVFQVPETLQFCVYKAVCGDNPALILGHGPKVILDDSSVDTDTAKCSVATNALNGVVIYAYGSPLKISGYTMAAINGGNGVQAPMVAGTEAFGFKVSPTSGDIAAASAYADTGGNDYTFDNAMIPPSTLGAAISTQAAPGPINSNVLTLTFAATASKSTPAGTYQTAISLVATATF